MNRLAESARVLFVAALMASTSTGVWADTVQASAAKIRDVTVYRDRAEIIREVRIDLPAGPSTVEFRGIPPGVEADSLRVSARGVPSVLGAVEVVEIVVAPVETPELVAARDHLRDLERQVAEHAASKAVDAELREFLSSLRATTGDLGSRQLGEGRVEPEAVSAFYELLAGRLRSLATGELERSDQLLDLKKKHDLAKAHLATLRPAASIRSRIAKVDLEARRAGELTMRLAYVVPHASWYPSYRATLDATTGEVNLVVEGVVRQSTGEDWTDVALSLSSASPAQGVEPPMLNPWLLSPGREGFAETAMEKEVPGRFYQNVSQMAPKADEPADMEEAGLIKSAYNVAFEVSGSSDVPADGRDHRVVLRNETLAGALVHRTIPSLESRAYLTSVTTSPAAYPLLSGPVRVFAEGAYLGSFPLEEKGPGVELTMPFGVDNRLEVIRVPLPKSAGRQGITGKHREVEFGFRTQLHNLQDRAVTVVLEERIPVSEDERIVVELDKETTPGFKDSPRRPGVKLWTFEMAAGEKREILLAYRVRHPRDLRLPGLE